MDNAEAHDASTLRLIKKNSMGEDVSGKLPLSLTQLRLGCGCAHSAPSPTLWIRYMSVGHSPLAGMLRRDASASLGKPPSQKPDTRRWLI